MIFRSQDGRSIVNANCVDTFSLEGKSRKFFIYAYRGSDTTKLGEYSTEFQALEVFDRMEADIAEGGALYRLPKDKGLPYECPQCHNTEHVPGAKFCMICGMAFPSGTETPRE